MDGKTAEGSDSYLRQSLVKRQGTEEFKSVTKALKSKAVSAKASLEDILDSVVPPKVFLDTKGSKVMTRASPSKSSRDEVVELQMRLDSLLQERQARESGICPVREELYSQCFDELIRQVTIECPERGLLLKRVRDEVSMTLAAYQTLYDGSIAFGMRKKLQAEQGGSDLARQVQELEAKQALLKARLEQEKTKTEQVEKTISEKKAAEERRMQSEKEFLSFQAKHLEAFLKTVKSSSS